MNYLRTVILESMRRYTVIPAYGRAVPNDIKWWNGITIPKHAILNASAHGAHQNPGIFPQPEIFDPDRFTPENTSTRSPFAYVPFSAGSRNCIGQKFAMLEIYAVLSKILRNFELRSSIPEHKICFRVEAVLKADNGLFIRLFKRNHNNQFTQY